MGLSLRSSDLSVVFAATAVARTVAAAVSMPRPLRFSCVIRLLYLKTPPSSLVAPEPSVFSCILSSLAPSVTTNESHEMYIIRQRQSASRSSPPMMPSPSSSIGHLRMSRLVSERLYLMACVMTGEPIWLSLRSSVEMLHASERSTSTMSGPTERSVSLLLPIWSDLRKLHLPASSVSKKRTPPRSARLMSVTSSVTSVDLRARWRCSRIEPPSEPPPGSILSLSIVLLAARMAPTTPHACRWIGCGPICSLPPALDRSIITLFIWPLSCCTGSVAMARSLVLFGCSRRRLCSVVLVASASASTSMCSGLTAERVSWVSVELARMRPAKRENERRDRMTSLSLRSTVYDGGMFSFRL